MPNSRLGPRIDLGAVAETVNFSLALVVGKSQINGIVVSSIVERSGLKAILEVPEKAGKALANKPGVVILDGGPDNRDCDAVLGDIAEHRRASGGKIPLVILLSTRNVNPEGLPYARAVDAVVAKPFTPESLQPVVDKLLAQARG
ncbi:MAG TPA: response regulator [Rhizobiaceae bacterium]|nr:response regulator [Rhizobiaceae bacterium]